jgi:DNA-binding LacI/PurR family transcriptional regulator
MAKGILISFRDRGLRWPDDLSLVLIGTPDWADLLSPSLACVERPELEMGGAAASLLLEKLKTPDYRQPKTVLPTRFIPGQSIRTVGPSGGGR